MEGKTLARVSASELRRLMKFTRLREHLELGMLLSRVITRGEQTGRGAYRLGRELQPVCFCETSAHVGFGIVKLSQPRSCVSSVPCLPITPVNSLVHRAVWGNHSSRVSYWSMKSQNIIDVSISLRKTGRPPNLLRNFTSSV